MEKEQNSKPEENINNKTNSPEDLNKENDKKLKEKEVELSPEEKIKELEEKLARTLAEMENQRRRYEKEKDDAFDYGGFAFAKETLNLIDDLERSKLTLQNDSTLKDTDALKKIPGAETMIANAKAHNPHNRLTQTSDIGDFLKILVGYESSWLTGNIIRLDGGEDITG